MEINFSYKISFALIISWLLSGCLLLNDANEYKNNQDLKPSPGRSLVVIGLGIEKLESSWKYPKVGITFDEYDVMHQRITGNCWRYNNFQASLPARPDIIQYRVFDVPPGFYTYSAFCVVKLQTQDDKALAFLVPAEQVVYLGDFVRTSQGHFEIRRNLKIATSVLKNKFPKYEGTPIVAESISVAPPRPFLCAP